MELVFNAEYVKQVLDDRELTYADLERMMNECGYKISESSIKKWFMNTKPIPPTLKNMTGMAKALKIPINKIILKGKSDSGVYGVKEIAIVGYASCGAPEMCEYQDNEVFYLPTNIWNDRMYAIRGCGDSMSPEIDNNDIVVCDPYMKISNGDLVHYTLFNETAIKIYYEDENGVIKLVPRNQSPFFRTVNIMPNDKELLDNFKAAKVVSITKTELNNRIARLKAVGLA
ncbi:S24 family peptidase [Campylobacter sp. RM16191]|uniref:S24 family peptidase n=1 Tax=Campylobacter sp. RM16191 TaxID=1705728 RepID=UPI00147345AB|nr:S24 family peptidase [Campylobacter sp. RM16191]